MSGLSNIPQPRNEPVLSYAPGTPERAALKAALGAVGAQQIEIPAVVAGREVRTGDTHDVVSPHCHHRVLAKVHQADGATIGAATKAAVEAQRDWGHWRFEDRAAVFLKAADLLATVHRQLLNAATMLGQSKTAYQAEIDSACELIDFLRYNVHFAERIYREQPESSPGMWNRLDHRPLEGFVYAITPFNFTAIGGNLPTAPALMGNAVVWKPSTTATLSNWHFFRLLQEAGLPPGVINFLPGDSIEISKTLLADRHLAGIHFTGSTAVFQSLWRTIGENLGKYAGYPRIVGETGGKDFILFHPSAELEASATAVLRGAFEFQGQKCSAVSRIYVPKSLWPSLRERLTDQIAGLKVGDPRDFSVFVGAVIDRAAYDKISGYQQLAKDTAQVLAGGDADDSEGFFIDPTLVQVDDPKHRLMQEEIFGPVVTAYVYDDARWDETLDLVDGTSPYGLTGAVFARDRGAVLQAMSRLRHAAGNFYINDKPTGAVVSQQPFGGARASGTDDKAGSLWNLTRWVSPRSIKETFVPPTDWRYPYMG